MVDIERLINLSDFVISNKMLNNFITYNINISLSKNCNDILVENYIKEEFNKIIYNFLSKSITECKNINFKDVRNLITSKNQILHPTKKLEEVVKSEIGYKNVYSNLRIISDLMDSQFLKISFDKDKEKKQIYKIGNYNGMNIYCDPLLRYDDYSILFLNNIEYNLINYKYDYNKNSNFSPYINDTMIRITFDLALEINDLKVMNIIDNENVKALHILKSIVRDEKINNLLNEK